MKRYGILLFLLFICLETLQAQSQEEQAEIDSLTAVLQTDLEPLNEVKTLHKILVLYSYFDSAKTAQYFDKLLPKASQIKTDTIISDAYYNYGWLMIDQGHLEKAKTFFEQAIQYAKQGKNLSKEGKGYDGLHEIEIRKGNYQKAIEYNQKFLQKSQEAKNEDDIASAYNSFGNVYNLLMRIRGKNRLVDNLLKDV